MRILRFALALGCIGGVADAREIAKQFTLELALPTPEASPVQGELAVKPPEGLSDKNFLKGVA